MRVSGLDSDNDFTFGNGKSNYITNAEAVRQNVKTRLEFFNNDWFLDTKYGIDWVTLLGNRGTEKLILKQLELVILGTEGVQFIETLDIAVDRQSRKIAINYSLSTFFDEPLPEFVSIEI